MRPIAPVEHIVASLSSTLSGVDRRTRNAGIVLTGIAILAVGLLAAPVGAQSGNSVNLTADGQTAVEPGEQFVITYTLTNEGPETVSSAGLDVTIPENVSVAGVSGDGSGQPSRLYLQTLTPGESIHVTYTFDASENLSYGDTVDIGTDGVLNDDTGNSATVTQSVDVTETAPEATLSVDVPATVRPNGTFNATYTLANDGNERVGGGSLTVTLPDGLSIASTTGDGSGREDRFFLDSLNPGDSVATTYTLTASRSLSPGDSVDIGATGSLISGGTISTNDTATKRLTVERPQILPTLDIDPDTRTAVDIGDATTTEDETTVVIDETLVERLRFETVPTSGSVEVGTFDNPPTAIAETVTSALDGGRSTDVVTVAAVDVVLPSEQTADESATVELNVSDAVENPQNVTIASRTGGEWERAGADATDSGVTTVSVPLDTASVFAIVESPSTARQSDSATATPTSTTATPTETTPSDPTRATPTQTETVQATSTPSTDGPGFGFVVALLAVLTTTVLARSRHEG